MANKTALGWAILLCLVCLLPLGLMGQDNAQQYRRPGTNTEYELIDWTTYSMTRWVTSLAVGREFVYFGTTGGITRYNLYSNQWDRPHTVSDGLADNFIIAVAYDFNTDYIWCSTPQGVSVYRSIWRRWENVFKDELRLSNSDEIVSIGFDREQVWLESRAGLFFKSENQTTQFESIAAGAIPNASISWFGNRAFLGAQMPELVMHGGYFFDSRGIIKDTNLDDYPVTCIGRDPWNTIWVGSWGLGVGKADARIKILEMIPDGLFISEVSAFEIDGDGNVWAGGRGEYNGQSGITFREFDRNQVHYYQARFISNMYNDQINAVAIDYPYVWFGSEYGLLRFNLDKNEWKTFDTSLGLRDNYVYDVEVDSNNVWIGTLLGLCRLDKTKMFEKDYRIQNIAERDILNIKVYDIEVMQNLLWIGTEFGVYIYDKNIQSGGFEDEPEGPQNDQVTAVAVLEDKEVWFGTPDGIEVYDLGKKRWLGAPERRFYTSTYVNFIDVDSSAAWVATNEGVLKFDKKRNLWRKFDVVDGLPSNIVNWIEIDGDYVWFGTPEGLTRFYWNAPYRID